MESFSDLFKRLRKEVGLTQQQVAAATGLHQSFIAGIETGRKSGLSTESLHKVCSLFKVPLDTFSTQLAPGVSVPPPPGNVVEVEGFPMPFVGTVGASEFDSPTVYETPGTHRTALRYPKGSIALLVRGTSCEPRIPDGSIVVVAPTVEAIEGRYHVIQSAGGYMLKLFTGGKFVRFDGKKRKSVKLDESTRVVGVVERVELEQPREEPRKKGK